MSETISKCQTILSQTIIPSPYIDSRCGPQKYEQIECISPGFRLGGIQHKRREGSIKIYVPFEDKFGVFRFDPFPFHLVGGFNPSEEYACQLGGLFPIYGKIKNVPNHQPAIKHLTSQDFESESVSAFKEGTICASVNL